MGGDVSEWKEIETAPKRGYFLAYWPAVKLDEDNELTDKPARQPGFIGVAYRDASGLWCEPEALNAVGENFGDDWCYAPEPTHWRLLPEPPKV